MEDESICDSLSAPRLLKQPSQFSENTSRLHEDDLFSPNKPVSVEQNKSKIPTCTTVDNTETDDFYIDDFDIDDFNESDIPEYFEEAPTSSVQRQNRITAPAVKEGGPSKSSWDKKPSTSVSTPKPPKISSPGKSD